jgi:hypothetical protein
MNEVKTVRHWIVDRALGLLRLKETVDARRLSRVNGW